MDHANNDKRQVSEVKRTESYSHILVTKKQAVRVAAPASHVTLTFDLLTLKVVFESHVTWATSAPILVFLGLSVFDLVSMYATDVRQTSDAHHRLMSIGGGIINEFDLPLVPISQSE